MKERRKITKEIEKEPKKEILPGEEKPRNLAEIIATMTPLEKAVLGAIGIGNYHSSDIFEEANKKGRFKI